MKNEIELSIGIIGKICSGKSTLATSLSDNNGIPIVSFGKYLKHYSLEHSLSVDREDLQNLGEKFIKKSPLIFLQNALSYDNIKRDQIIIEGIRHKVILEGIQEISKKTIFIYIHADLETRYERYVKREKDSDKLKSYSDFLKSDGHSVEQEIDLLRSFCNLDFDSSGQSVSYMISQINALM